MMQAYAELMRTVDLQPGTMRHASTWATCSWPASSPTGSEQAKAVLAAERQQRRRVCPALQHCFSEGRSRRSAHSDQHALAIDPNRAGFHASLGFLESSDPANAASAEEELRKAVSLDGKNVTAHLILAALLERKGDMAVSEGEMKAAVAADPKSINARGSLANHYLARATPQRPRRRFSRQPRISMRTAPAPTCWQPTTFAPTSLIRPPRPTPISYRSTRRALR